MKELKTNNYYSLSCSIIPDNKIRQIIGTYISSDTFDTTLDYLVDSVYHLKNASPDTYYSLPCFTNAEYDTNSDLFFRTFYDLVIAAQDTSHDDYSSAWRTEDIYGNLVIDIHNVDPMSFSPNNVSIKQVKGKYRSRSRPHGMYITLGWLNAFSTDEDDERIYSVRNFNTRGTGWPAADYVDNNEVQPSDARITSVMADSYYDGSHLDPNTGTYLLRITIRIRVFRGSLEYEIYSPGGQQPSLSGGLNTSLLSSITLSIDYQVRGSGEQVEFEYHSADNDYADYPLRIEGNEYTNDNVYYQKNSGEVIWSNWISKDILKKYRNGKLFAKAKVKIKWMMDNNIHINSQMIVKDTNGNYISKIVNGTLKECIFEVKNIEYECTEEGYYANITLLEIGTLKSMYEVVDSNNHNIVDSNNHSIVVAEEEED